MLKYGLGLVGGAVLGSFIYWSRRSKSKVEPKVEPNEKPKEVQFHRGVLVSGPMKLVADDELQITTELNLMLDGLLRDTVIVGNAEQGVDVLVQATVLRKIVEHYKVGCSNGPKLEVWDLRKPNKDYPPVPVIQGLQLLSENERKILDAIMNENKTLVQANWIDGASFAVRDRWMTKRARSFPFFKSLHYLYKGGEDSRLTFFLLFTLLTFFSLFDEIRNVGGAGGNIMREVLLDSLDRKSGESESDFSNRIESIIGDGKCTLFLIFFD